jgi:hypothetical protein
LNTKIEFAASIEPNWRQLDPDGDCAMVAPRDRIWRERRGNRRIERRFPSRYACDYSRVCAAVRQFFLQVRNFQKSLLNTKIIHAMVLIARRPEEASKVERDEMPRIDVTPRL